MITPVPSTQLLDALRWRYATKQFDPTTKISPEDWATLASALTLSPSSGGLQPWRFIVVNDPTVRAKLLPASFDQKQIVEASHLVVFAAKADIVAADVDAHITRTAAVRGVSTESLASFRQMLVGGIVEGKDQSGRRAWAAHQAYLALGNLLTSAALLGIDTCPMEGFLPDQYDAILGLADKGLTSVVVCTLGYRAAGDAYAKLPKVRFPGENTLVYV